ncbi:hypothetical protein JCM5353_001160 [Sporobolomyces roseus]
MQALPSIPNAHDFLQLSPAEQIALNSAEAHVDRQLMDEHHDASRRGQTLNQELAKIIHLALQKNVNDEATLKIWAQDFEKIFKEAGRTDFALDLIRMRLEDIEESVRKGETLTEWSYWYLERRIKTRFEPFVMIGKHKITNGYGIWYSEIEAGLNSIRVKIDIQIRNQIPPYNSQHSDFYNQTLRTYIYVLGIAVLYSKRCPPPEEAQEQWLQRIRILKILEVLVDGHHSFLKGQHLSPLFQTINIFERMKPQHPLYRPQASLEKAGRIDWTATRKRRIYFG